MALICCYRVPNGEKMQPSPTRARKYWRRNRPHWRDFAYMLRGLRKKIPPALPVSVRFCPLPDTILGQCGRTAARFVIRLNSNMNQYQSIDVLLHEWAHAISWNFSLDKLSKKNDPAVKAAFETVSHDATWGVAYARVWLVNIELLAEYVPLPEKNDPLPTQPWPPVYVWNGESSNGSK